VEIALGKASSPRPDQHIIGLDNALRQLYFNHSGDRFLSITREGALKIREIDSCRLPGRSLSGRCPGG